MSRRAGTRAVTPSSLPYRFLLDEDLDPKAATVARGLALDMVSVQEVGRRGLPDDDHLRWAARERRIMITRNRDDCIEWTTAFFQKGEAHAGVLIVPTVLSIQRTERLAHAIQRWAQRTLQRFGYAPLSPYFVEFVGD